jgi:thiol-disulfide isomerase/thioredoxin
MNINAFSTPVLSAFPRVFTPMVCVAALLAAAALPPVAGGTTAPPPARATTRPVAAITAEMKQLGTALSQAMAGGVLTDPAKRASAAPTVLPLFRREVALFQEFGVANHNEKDLAGIQQRLASTLYLFGDPETVRTVDAAAGSPNPTDSAEAQGIRLNARWLAAGRDAAAQQGLAAELEKLDVAQPQSDPLTFLTFSFSSTAVSPDLRSQLLQAMKSMRSPTALRMAGPDDGEAAAAQKLSALTGKPLTVSATTVDGKPFSTDQYKGKVVLVDFWATWCGPCKAGLPEVKDLYGKYHEKGLEIVGVSNDYAPDAVRAFTAAQGMPWVELLDAPAAASHQWNPVTLGYGIRGIPTMFLIDRKGVCRSVSARSELATLIPALLAG